MDFLDQQDQDNTVVSVLHSPLLHEFQPNGVLQKPERFDSAWVKKLALNFEKKISKNAELRAKFEAEPQKYV